MGVYGYTAYCASKFALVGMAQALQMEVSLSVERAVLLYLTGKYLGRGGRDIFFGGRGVRRQVTFGVCPLSPGWYL